MSEPAIAFLSNRKLHVRKNGVTRMVESEFERSVRERAASIERRHSWKTQGRGAMFTGMWAQSPKGLNFSPVLMTGITSEPGGGLLYTMETDAVSGIFLFDAEGAETRLFHTADFRIRHPALHSDGATLAVSIVHKDNMRSNIAVLPVHGTDFREVTEGDSFDQFPQWVPGGKRIVFQSAGIGRDAAGRFVGLGPCSIQTLDLDSGDLDEISEPGRDLLQPHQAAGGSLYYIRKPYHTGLPDASLLGSLKDAVLFPFRMGRAVLQYFNIFSMMYTGKPLVTRNGAVQPHMDPRKAFVYGNLARAQMIEPAEEEDQARAPSSWELVRRDSSGETETVARGVLAFDITADNDVIYSDGAAIRRLGSDGGSERVFKGEWIEQVLAL